MDWTPGMIAPDKVELLQRFLASLPESAAVRLAKAVEVDRLNDGKALPHELILEALRPALRHTRQTSRTLTPLRLFCRPFEDLLLVEAIVLDSRSEGMKDQGFRGQIWG